MTPVEAEKVLMANIIEFLTIGFEMEHLYFDRLNAGFIKHRIRLCRAGTADLVVYKAAQVCGYRVCRTIFLEVKSEEGELSDDQKAWQKRVEAQGAEYYIVRSVEEVMRAVA